MAVPAFNLATLEQRVRERADMVGSLFVSTTEVKSYMEAAWQELYGLASAEYEDLLVTTKTLILSPGTVVYGLQTDVKKVRGVRIKQDEFLRPFSLREIQNMDRAGRSGRPVGYWLTGDITNQLGVMAIEVLPAPDTTYTLTYYYQPSIGLVDVATFGSVSMLASWDEFVVVSAAIKCKDKEESSVSVLMSEKQALLANMRTSWTPVDVSEAQRVTALTGAFGRNRRAYDYVGPDDDS